MTIETLYNTLIQNFPNFDNYDPSWQQLQQQARTHCIQQGFPNKKWEAYRYTPLNRLLPDDDITSNSPPQPQPHLISPGYHIFLTDNITIHTPLPQGINIIQLTPQDPIPAHIKKHVGKYASTHQDLFIALNTSTFQRLNTISIQENHIIPHPIYLHHLGNTPSITHPRTFFSFGKKSKAHIVDILYSSTQYKFVNHVTERYLAPHAHITHTLIHLSNPSSQLRQCYHAHNILEEQSTLTDFTLLLGGKFFRHQQIAECIGSHSNATFYGSYLTHKNNFIETHNKLVHHLPNTTGHTYYKGIATQESTSVFRGIIDVKKPAQKTSTAQYHHGWILNNAHIYARPELMIHADDIVCKHGATIGKGIDKMLFYLQSRGINLQEAKKLLIESFINSPWINFQEKSVKNFIEDMLHLHIPIYLQA